MIFQEDGVLFAPLHCMFTVCSVAFFVFSIPRWKHLITSIRAICFDGTFAGVSGVPKAGATKPGKEPHVTVQICAYNEGAVVPATIARACSIDWPRNKLTIQVCDDSTDRKSILLIEKSVKYWEKQGADIVRLTRPDRIGYKAGNLRYNFDMIKGDHVAYFDADHWPESDFLKNTMPYFFDENGKPKKRIALVQTPWAFHNTHENILTECDSFGIDTFYIYEFGRCIKHKFFGFWGTGGVWRKQAVADAGGFTWESVTEDILLSYKAYMRKGYEFIYLPQFPQCLEVPAGMLAHLQQKNRWTKGYLQVFRLYGWTMLCSSKIPFVIKYEFFAHVLGALQLVFCALSYMIFPHLKAPALTNSWCFRFLTITPTLEYFLSILFAQTTKKPASNGHYSSVWSRLARLRFFVPSCILQMGMTGFETKAALEGLFSKDATFLTTPKSGASNKAKRCWSDDLVACLGLMVALHQIVVVTVNNPYADIDSLALRYTWMFWNTCFVSGLICVPTAFFLAKYRHATRKSVGCMWLPSRSLLGMLLTPLVTLGQVVAIGAHSEARMREDAAFII